MDRAGGSAGTQLIGDGLACASALIYTAQVLLAARGRKVLNLFTFSVINTSGAILFLSVGSIAIEGSRIGSAEADGLWGWVDRDRVLVMLIFGFVVGMIGLLGFNFWYARARRRRRRRPAQSGAGTDDLIWYDGGACGGGSVKYISTIVLTAVQLSDPAITGLMSWMAGLEYVCLPHRTSSVPVSA